MKIPHSHSRGTQPLYKFFWEWRSDMEPMCLQSHYAKEKIFCLLALVKGTGDSRGRTAGIYCYIPRAEPEQFQIMQDLLETGKPWELEE
jgi:hypothetical protein